MTVAINSPKLSTPEIINIRPCHCSFSRPKINGSHDSLQAQYARVTLYTTGPTHAKLVSLTSPCCSGWPCPMNTLKANNGPLDPGVGDERFFRFKRNAWNFLIHTVLRKLRGTIVNIILPPRVLFHCREIYFTAATFILLPRVLFYCREIYFTAASFILAPRVLFYCRKFYYTAASFILLQVVKIKLAVVKIKLAAAK